MMTVKDLQFLACCDE